MNIQHYLATETEHPKRLFISVSQSEHVYFPVRIRYMRLARAARSDQAPRVISNLPTTAGPCQAFSF